MATITCRVPDDKKAALVKLADKKGLNLSNYTRSVMYAELERETGKE